MDRLEFLQLASSIGFAMTGFVIGSVWWLNISVFRKLLPIIVVLKFPIIGFSWYWVEFVLDRREKKKEEQRKKEEKEKEEEKKKKQMEKMSK